MAVNMPIGLWVRDELLRGHKACVDEAVKYLVGEATWDSFGRVTIDLDIHFPKLADGLESDVRAYAANHRR